MFKPDVFCCQKSFQRNSLDNLKSRGLKMWVARSLNKCLGISNERAWRCLCLLLSRHLRLWCSLNSANLSVVVTSAIASSNRCLTSSNKKLVETSALLLVTIRLCNCLLTASENGHEIGPLSLLTRCRLGCPMLSNHVGSLQSNCVQPSRLDAQKSHIARADRVSPS